MPRVVREKLSCPKLAQYFRENFRPREQWLVGIEVEMMGSDAATGRPIPYDAPGPSVRRVLEAYACEATTDSGKKSFRHAATAS